MIIITYGERKTNIWVREKTKVTDVIEQVGRRMYHCVSPPGNPTKEKDLEEDRRDGEETN